LVIDELYLDNTINVKYSTKSYKDKRKVAHSREDCLAFEKTHPALVTKEVWDIVQRVRQHKRRRTDMDEQNKHSGLVVCADCGTTMALHRAHKHVFFLVPSHFAFGKIGHCGGLIEIVRENPDGFPAHARFLRDLLSKKVFLTHWYKMKSSEPQWFPRLFFELHVLQPDRNDILSLKAVTLTRKPVPETV